MALKHIIKRLFGCLGLDIVRKSRNPARSLLGLRNFDIKTVIDVGANEGQFAKMILKTFPQANVYCFEPIPEPFKKLSQWAGKQRSGKIIVSNLAIGDKDRNVRMFNHTIHNSSSSLLKTTKLCESLYPFTKKQDTITVEQTTLDNWVKNLPSPPAHKILLKLDVQGYEDRVICGGCETFGQAEVCIVEVSLDRLYEGQATFKRLFTLLDGLGYCYAGNLNQAYADDGHVIYVDAVFLRQ